MTRKATTRIALLVVVLAISAVATAAASACRPIQPPSSDWCTFFLKGTVINGRCWVPSPTPKPPTGGKGGSGCHTDCGPGGSTCDTDCSGSTPTQPFVYSHRNGVLYCSTIPLLRADGSYGLAMDLDANQVGPDGSYDTGQGLVKLNNAIYVREGGRFHGAGCDMPPDYYETNITVDEAGNPSPDGPYYLAEEVTAVPA